MIELCIALEKLIEAFRDAVKETNALRNAYEEAMKNEEA